MRNQKGHRRFFLPRLGVFLLLSLVSWGLMAQEKEPAEKKETPKKEKREPKWKKPRSLAEREKRLKEAAKKRKAELGRIKGQLRWVRRPEAVLTEYEPDPELWETVNKFYTHLKGRELDVIYEQEGIPDFFPTRNAYYDFLDTMIPAMRERRFERHRLLDYKIHTITQNQARPDEAVVYISITSDDLLPFGKLMVYKHLWLRGPRWYPGKVMAEPATYWEKVR